MQDRPTATELLDDVAALLADEVVPVLDGNLRHHVRVAANLCRIVSREIAFGPELEAAELEALAPFVSGNVDRDDPLAVHRALAGQVRERPLDDFRGDWPDDLRALRDALDAIVDGKLSVAKPGYDQAELPASERPR